MTSPAPMSVEAHLAYITGRRETVERDAKFLREQLAAWRKADEGATTFLGRVRAAFWWALTEAWTSRVEGVAARLDQEAVALRAEELKLQRAKEHAPRGLLDRFWR